MSHQVTLTNWLAIMLASVAGFGLLLAPPEQTQPVRAVIRDGALPGLRAADAATQFALTLPSRFDIPGRFQPAPLQNDAQAALLAERDAWERRCRALQAVNAQLTGELEQFKSRHTAPLVAEPGTPLFVPELIEAKIIGAEALRQATQRTSFRRVVDVGSGDDIVSADYVVSGDSSTPSAEPHLIDQGKDSGLRADQPVFAGRCVVGKIGQVGRWTSTVIPLTDLAFRGRAQLVRSSPRGMVLGAEGVVAGDEQGKCRLQLIPATEPVGVGDDVYTSVRQSSLPIPMYYGRVVKAHLPEGATHWEIVVQPAETLHEARAVQVLRSVLNTARTTFELAPAERL